MPAVFVLDLAEALALDGARDHDRGLAGGLARLLQCLIDLLQIVAIDHDGAASERLDPVPVMVGLPFVFGRAALAEPVDIEDGGEVRQPVVAGLVESLPDGALRQLAVAGKCPHVIGQLVQLAAGEGDADCDRQSLPQRAGGDIDPGQRRRGMALQARTELAKGQHLVVGDHTDRLEDGVEQRRRMAFREDQVVVVRLLRIVPVIEEVPRDQHRHQVGGRHR